MSGRGGPRKLRMSGPDGGEDPVAGELGDVHHERW